MAREATVLLEYQDLIAGPPVPTQSLYSQACSSDDVTVNAWSKTWIANIKANRVTAGGDFSTSGVGKLFGLHQNKACILAGSGPSLKLNGHLLAKRNGLPLISCLHNFHFFTDLGITPDFYVSLDAGAVVLEEISEGGKLSAEDYWAKTEGVPLVAYIGSHPDLAKKWRGPIYWYSAALPSGETRRLADEAAGFYTRMGSGGNVLGACLYLARGFLGCQTVAFVGADFSFSYENKFHGWDSKYDANLGQCLKVTDIYGNKRKTWQSYHNFKAWFDFIACKVPGSYFNCTEGGTLGAYAEGNISQFKYMDLSDFLGMCAMNEHLRPQCELPGVDQETMLF